MFIVDVKQMRKLDKLVQDKYGISGLILMENAGLRSNDIVLNLLNKKRKKKVIIICGPGNNGGDGFVLARHLFNNGMKVKVVLCSKKQAFKGDALVNLNILLKMRFEIEEIINMKGLRAMKNDLAKCDLVVDAIFGIGLNKVVSGLFAEVINCINESNKPVIALDIPSGLSADTGKILGVCARAYATITFGALKGGFFLNEGPDYSGKLYVVDIGFPRYLYNSKNCLSG